MCYCIWLRHRPTLSIISLTSLTHFATLNGTHSTRIQTQVPSRATRVQVLNPRIDYTCGESTNSLTTNATSCTRKSCDPVEDFTSLNLVRNSSSSNGCTIHGQELRTTESCDVVCASGYVQIDGDGTYNRVLLMLVYVVET